MKFKKAKIILFTAATIIFIVAVTFTIKYSIQIRETLIPLFISVIIFYIISPITDFFTNRKMKRKTAVIITYVVFLSVLILIFVFIIPAIVKDIKGIINSFPDMMISAKNLINSFISRINNLGMNEEVRQILIDSINNRIPKLEESLKNLVENMAEGIVNIFEFFVNLVLGLVIAYYFIADKEFFMQRLDSVVPRKNRPLIRKTLKDINNVLKNFFQGQLFIAVLLAIVEIIVLYIMGIRYAFLLGIIGGFSNLIPVLGPFIGAIPAVGVALLQSPVKAFWLTIFFIIIQQLEGGLITPRIMKNKVGLHEVTTILVVLIGGKIAGIAGMFLAVPLTAIIKSIGFNIIDEVSRLKKDDLV